jgi:hypothetical protein
MTKSSPSPRRSSGPTPSTPTWKWPWVTSHDIAPTPPLDEPANAKSREMGPDVARCQARSLARVRRIREGHEALLEAERQAWRALQASVDALLARSRTTAAPDGEECVRSPSDRHEQATRPTTARPSRDAEREAAVMSGRNVESGGGVAVIASDRLLWSDVTGKTRRSPPLSDLRAARR